MTPPIERRKLQLDYVDGLRALAALYIVLHHSLQACPLILPHLSHILAYGEQVVCIFITISGFCLALPQAAKGVWTVEPLNFYQRRATRILPPYYAAVALALCFHLYRLWRYGELIVHQQVWTHLLIIQNWQPNMFTIAGPLWSVAVECQVYLLFPVIIWIRRRFGTIAMLVSGIVVGQGSFHFLHARGMTNMLTYFVFGIACAEWAFSAKAKHLLAYVMCFSLLCSVTICRHDGHLLDLAAAVFFGSMMAYLAQSDVHPMRKALSWKPLAWVGTFSYSIYLVHGIFSEHVENVLNRAGVAPGPRYLTVVELTMVLALVVSYFFHVVVERPFMSTKRRLAESNDAAAVLEGVTPTNAMAA